MSDEPQVTSGLPPQPARHLVTVEIPIGDIDYNEDNYNRQDDKTFAAEMDSILLYGFVDPCLLRPFTAEEIAPQPERMGRYEMIDGEHRVRSMHTFREVGLPPGAHPELADLVERWVVPCIVRPMSKAWANKLLAVMAETRGRGDTVRRGQLFAGLAQEMSIEDLVKGLPYDEQEMQELIKVGEFDWDTYQGNQGSGNSDDDDEKAGFKLLLTGPEGLVEEVKIAIKKLKKDRGATWATVQWTLK